MALAVAVVGDLAGLAAFGVYAVTIGFVFAESGLLLGFFLPGDTVLFAAGLLAADDSRGISVAWLAAGVAVAAVAGNAVGYGFGARIGRPAFERRAGRLVNAQTLDRLDQFYRRFGVLSVVGARFVPWLRTFVPILAGAVRMPVGRFAAASVAGAVGWGVGIVLLGYAAASTPGLKHASTAVGAGFAVAFAVIAGVAWWRSRRARRTQDGHG